MKGPAWIALTGLFVAASFSGLPAQNPDYVLTVGNGGGPPGTTVDIGVTLTNSGGPVAAWSFGVCNDASQVTPVDGNPGAILDTLNGGDPVDFLQVGLFPDGVIMGCVVDFFGINTLPPGIFVLLDIEYDLDGIPGVAELALCETLDMPPVGVVIVNDAGESIPPVQVDGSITYSVNIPLFEFSVPDATVGFDPGTGDSEFPISASIMEDPSGLGFPNDTFGFSMGLAHDADLLSVVSVDTMPVLDALNGGAGPDFFDATLLAGGFTSGVVYSFNDATQVIQFVSSQEVLEITYGTNPSAFIGQLFSVATVLDWTNSLGNPPVVNVVAINLVGDVVPVTFSNGTLTLIPQGDFLIRGDCTADGSYGLGDPIALLGSLFSGTGPVECDDACDGNDDGILSLADAVFLLEDIFSMGADPPPPFPSCNTDPTPDALDCGSYPPCP